MARLKGQTEPDFGIVDTVASLSERLAAVEQSLDALMDERWSRVSDNFATINANILALHERVETLEHNVRSKK